MSRIAVIGAGWAGLSAAIAAVEAGFEVHLFEMSGDAGGRARSHHGTHGTLDNGQHILIGAYRESLRLMRVVGVDPDSALLRMPLQLVYPDGTGLVLPPGSPSLSFARGVWATRHWSWSDRWTLLATALQWRASGFTCAPHQTVADLCRLLPPAIQRDLIEPLCVSALNTSVAVASGQVFLRVLSDALFGGPGSSDLLLPRVGLSALFAEPAIRWLKQRGTVIHLRQRIAKIEACASGWHVAGCEFESAVVATSAHEAARLIAPINSSWSAATQAMDYQPIITVWLVEPRLSFGRPMVALRCDAQRPAQFGFDLSRLGGPAGVFAFVISAATASVERGTHAMVQALLSQVRQAFAGSFVDDNCVLHVHTERRATFTCRAGLQRPSASIAPGLVAAGDYLQGPYPATLEGATQSGMQAATMQLARLSERPNL